MCYGSIIIMAIKTRQGNKRENLSFKTKLNQVRKVLAEVQVSVLQEMMTLFHWNLYRLNDILKISNNKAIKF